MGSRAHRSPNRTAALVGLGVVAAMLTGVGGHQLYASGALSLTPLSAPGAGGPAVYSSRAAGVPMCAVVHGAVVEGRPSSLVTFGGEQGRPTPGMQSVDGSLGVGGVCD